MEKIDVTISEQVLVECGTQGADEFVAAVAAAVKQAAGGELTADVLATLNADQITLWGWTILHEEVMDGGFIQLIHNGYGPFFFDNPFARAIKAWGMRDLSKCLYDVSRLYRQHGAALTAEMNDEDFMALYEAHPDFDAFDDDFVMREEEFVGQVALYIDEHLDSFVRVIN